MATATSVFTNPDWAVTASFNAMAGAFVDANLQAFGWVYVAQTGDVNPSTMAAPGINTFGGFRVYRSNDGLTNFYMRVDFGSNAYAGIGAPAVKIQIGTGVNGSGVLTGQVGTQITMKNSANAGSFRSYMSGDAGRVMMLINSGEASTSLSSGSFSFAVGRTVDTAGAANADGVEFYYCTSQSNSFGQQYIPFSGTIPTAESNGWICAMTKTQPAVIGADTLIGIPQSWDASGLKNPTVHVGVHDQTTLTTSVGSTVSFNLYGSSKTYLVSGNQQAIYGTNFRPLLRYD